MFRGRKGQFVRPATFFFFFFFTTTTAVRQHACCQAVYLNQQTRKQRRRKNYFEYGFAVYIWTTANKKGAGTCILFRFQRASALLAGEERNTKWRKQRGDLRFVERWETAQGYGNAFEKRKKERKKIRNSSGACVINWYGQSSYPTNDAGENWDQRKKQVSRNLTPACKFFLPRGYITFRFRKGLVLQIFLSAIIGGRNSRALGKNFHQSLGDDFWKREKKSNAHAQITRWL